VHWQSRPPLTAADPLAKREYARIAASEHVFGGNRMALIQWSSELSVEIKAIDKQHQKLIAMINKLDEAMRQGKGRAVMHKIIEGLVTYMQIHFACEEIFFAQFRYPYTAQHVKEHMEFARKVAKFQRDFDNGDLTLSTKVINFLSVWLRDHIQGTDRKYVKFLHQKGLK
jgi:hemerythrin